MTTTMTTTRTFAAAAAAAVLLLVGCSTGDADTAGAGRPVPTAPAPDRTNTGTDDGAGVAPYTAPPAGSDVGAAAGGHHTDTDADATGDEVDDDDGWIDGDLAQPGDVGVPAPVVGDDLDPAQVAAATDLAHLFLEQINSWTPDVSEAARIAALEPLLSDNATEQARRTADRWGELDGVRADSGDVAVANVDSFTITHADPDRIDATATVQIDRADRWDGWTQRVVVNVTLTPNDDGDGGWVVDRWAVR